MNNNSDNTTPGKRSTNRKQRIRDYMRTHAVKWTEAARAIDAQRPPLTITARPGTGVPTWMVEGHLARHPETTRDNATQEVAALLWRQDREIADEAIQSTYAAVLNAALEEVRRRLAQPTSDRPVMEVHVTWSRMAAEARGILGGSAFSIAAHEGASVNVRFLVHDDPFLDPEPAEAVWISR